MTEFVKRSAREAADIGLSRYFTGLPCKHGHISERMISNGSCVSCLNERRNKHRALNYAQQKEWRARNPAKRAEEARRWRAKHPELSAEIHKRHREKNIISIRERNRDAKKRLRAINPEAEKVRLRRWAARKLVEREQLAGRKRPDLCDVCGPFYIGQIVFDHSHTHGHFRGWICDRCNKVLGLMKDSASLLHSLAKYLEKDDEQIDCGGAQKIAR